MKRWFFSMAAVAGLPSLAGAEQAHFTILTDLAGGGSGSGARAISADGRVITGFGTDANGSVAVRWVDGVPTAIGDLPSGRRATAGLAITPDGNTIVGGGYAQWGFVKTGSSTLELIAPAGIGIPDVSAYDISDDGHVVVGRGSTFPAAAVRWVDGVPSTLVKLSGSTLGAGASASGVSADGSIVVGASDSTSGVQACRWQNGVVTALGDLAGGAFGSGAFDVSANGTVIVGYGSNSSGAVAARWVNGVISSLGDLAGGETQAYAMAVSPNGNYIAGMGTRADGDAAFIWDSTNGMRDLNVVLTSQGVSLDGVVLTAAYAIQDDGLTIVGQGNTTGPAPTAFAWVARLGQPPLICDGDLNGDSIVDLADLGIVLANFGRHGLLLHDGDFDCDGDVDLSDLGVVLSLFGQHCA